ncbi:MAG: DNA polymerase III subunit epsilon [Demequinaceae bacterium]|nr:DNA polymerase III subunit epsilon [Demequinaceae bacterium]
MQGFAVIDLETTGFAYTRSDRVCEVAVVLLDAHGRRQDAWTTLINPQRDLGAQHIHHIDATDARLAPTFAQAMGDLTELLRGRVVAAHNATFDASFLAAEYARAGAPIALTPADALCTMRMARQYLPGVGGKLADCCGHLGISLDDAHCALADAEATAELLAHYVRVSGGPAAWEGWHAHAAGLAWPATARSGVAPVRRGVASAGGDELRRLVRGFDASDLLPEAEAYLDLLDRVLLDRRISADERRALADQATQLGLSPADAARLHRTYMLRVVDAAVADALLTAQESAVIIQLAGLLDLADLEVEALLAEARARVGVGSGLVGPGGAGTGASRADAGAGLVLKPGDLVVLTGMSEARKRELTAVAEARGLVVWPNVKKGVAAVIAQDPGSGSGKARKAREYGIPVVGEGLLG